MNQKSKNEIIEDMMRRPIPRKKVGLVRLQMVKEGRALYGMNRMTDPVKAVEMASPLFAMADREMMLVLSLNTRLEPMALEIAAVGSHIIFGEDSLYYSFKEQGRIKYSDEEVA